MGGWSFEYVWYELDERLAWAALRASRMINYQQQAPQIHLVHLLTTLAGSLGEQKSKPMTALEFLRKTYPWAYPEDFDSLELPDVTSPLYSSAVVRDVELALSVGYLSQDDLAWFGSAKLRESGAWKD